MVKVRGIGWCEVEFSTLASMAQSRPPCHIIGQHIPVVPLPFHPSRTHHLACTSPCSGRPACICADEPRRPPHPPASRPPAGPLPPSRFSSGAWLSIPAREQALTLARQSRPAQALQAGRHDRHCAQEGRSARPPRETRRTSLDVFSEHLHGLPCRRRFCLLKEIARPHSPFPHPPHTPGIFSPNDLSSPALTSLPCLPPNHRSANSPHPPPPLHRPSYGRTILLRPLGHRFPRHSEHLHRHRRTGCRGHPDRARHASHSRRLLAKPQKSLQNRSTTRTMQRSRMGPLRGNYSSALPTCPMGRPSQYGTSSTSVVRTVNPLGSG